MNIEVTQKADGWMLGTIEGGYEWQAKVYEKPSEFGINGGRVSKLFIRPVGLGWQPALISYDRGWDKRPETQDATPLRAIPVPQRVSWRTAAVSETRAMP